MIENKLQNKFNVYGSWITKFTINGHSYGGKYDALHDGRIEQFLQSFPQAKTVLELGSLEGGHSIAIAMRPGVGAVTAIEGRPENIEKARFVQKLYGAPNINFIHANLETFDLASLGMFDVVFCVGLLYHLPEPWTLLSQISKVSGNLFLWTHYATSSKADLMRNQYRGKIYGEKGLEDPLSGLSIDSFWPMREDLKRMLEWAGFRKIRIIEDNPDHQNGPCITLGASVR